MKDFIANIFELWGKFYMGDFSKYMYKGDVYGEVALVLLLVPLVCFFIYYKIDNIKTAKKWIFYTLLFVVSLIVAFWAFNIADNGIELYLKAHKIKQTRIVDIDYFWFSVIVFFYTALLSFGYSLLFKLGAAKLRRIPF